jgi:hypothetical protein
MTKSDESGESTTPPQPTIEEILDWVYEGFPRDQLWQAPADVLLNAAYEFIEYRTQLRLDLRNLEESLRPAMAYLADEPSTLSVRFARLNVAVLRARLGVSPSSTFPDEDWICNRRFVDISGRLSTHGWLSTT